jgi:hypothetical protein
MIQKAQQTMRVFSGHLPLVAGALIPRRLFMRERPVPVTLMSISDCRGAKGLHRGGSSQSGESCVILVSENLIQIGRITGTSEFHCCLALWKARSVPLRYRHIRYLNQATGVYIIPEVGVIHRPA